MPTVDLGMNRGFTGDSIRSPNLSLDQPRASSAAANGPAFATHPDQPDLDFPP